MIDIKHLAELHASAAACNTFTDEYQRTVFDALPGLLAEVEELRRDKARLDAMDRQCPEGFDWSITTLDSGGWKIFPLRKDYVGDASRPYEHFSTARKAIDAARGGKP